MFKNKTEEGKLNVSGAVIKELRKEQHISQRILAEKIQLLGVDINKNAIQQIESGKRFVTDIELIAFAKYFMVSTDELLKSIL